VYISDGSGVTVEEEAMIASSKTRPDQAPLDKIGMLSDWTAVDKTDHSSDQSSDVDEADGSTADVNAFELTPNYGIQEEPHVEPVTEDAIMAGAKVTPRTNLLDDEPFGKLTATGPARNEDAIIASETSVAMHAAPRNTPSADPNEVDRAMVAPSKKTLKTGWIGQAAHSDEFSWLASEPSDERRASVDSLVLVDELVTAETSARVESAPPLPTVSEDIVTADKKASAEFDVDFSGLLVGPKASRVTSKPPPQSQPVTEVAEDQIQTTKVAARKIDDFLAQTNIEFANRSVPDSEESVSLDEVELNVPEQEVIRAVPVETQFAGPHVEEESVVPQSKRSAIIIPDFPASVSAKVKASPKTKKSGGVFGFFRRKNGDQNSTVEYPKVKSNSLDKRTTEKLQDVESKSGSTLPADAKKEKNGRGGRFRIGLNFGFGGKDKGGSASTDNQGGRSPKVQSPRTNSSGETAKSPSKTNIRVFEIMAGQQNNAEAGVGAGLNEQQAKTAPSTGPERPPVIAQVPPASIELTKPSSPSLPTTSVSLVSPTQPERPPPVIDVHVSTPPPPPTVPAFSSQYMVAVAIDFGLFYCYHTVAKISFLSKQINK